MLRRSLLLPGTAIAALTAGAATWVRGDVRRVGEELDVREYDASAIDAFWSARPACAARRVAEVGTGVLPFFGRLQIDRWRGALDNPDVQQAWAVEFRELLTDLGPTFIKFGQMLSIRPDILPPVAVYELQKLCDSCPAFPTSDALETIQAAFPGQPLASLFTDLGPDTLPIAAASLGQVYRLRLASTGEQVAVKVQRPEMINICTLDLFLIRRYAELVERAKDALTFLGVLEAREHFDVALLDTFAHASFFELDYVHEAANQQRFARELEPRLGGAVRVPAVYLDHTTRKVLTTEWVEGEQLAKCSADTINRLIPHGVECFLVQLLETGDFHADPHPGNLLVDEDGTLVLIDFGLCASVDLPDTKLMTATIVHLMEGDVSALLQDAIGLGFLPPTVDKAALLPVLEDIFRQGKLEAANEVQASSRQAAASSASDVDVAVGADAGNLVETAERRRLRFKEISGSLNEVFFKFPFRVPEYFALITRALIVLEGIALKGDPNFDIFASAYPFAVSRALSIFGVGQLSEVAVQVAKLRLAAAEAPAPAAPAKLRWGPNSSAE